jgi:hypothetical protein
VSVFTPTLGDQGGDRVAPRWLRKGHCETAAAPYRYRLASNSIRRSTASHWRTPGPKVRKAPPGSLRDRQSRRTERSDRFPTAPIMILTMSTPPSHSRRVCRASRLCAFSNRDRVGAT